MLRVAEQVVTLHVQVENFVLSIYDVECEGHRTIVLSLALVPVLMYCSYNSFFEYGRYNPSIQ